ncbi:hypothetical protein HYT54_04865 [Candidatus Woesearchaeota archaeon]|nr:hypothetical protein [Candidatus Woesearchaeota archaeon]
MIKGGKGGSKTSKSGLTFEKRVDLRLVLQGIKGYKVEGNELFFNDKLVARLYKKFDIYKKFLPKHKVNWKSKLSKKLLPDETIFVLSNKTLFIIEIKFQEVSGSVDEKLQTCDFKKKQYTKLLSDTDIDVEYVYVLNDWFKKPEYADVLDYIKSVGCHYFFTEIPLKFLGLQEPY